MSVNFTRLEGSGNNKTTLRFDFKAARHDRVGIDTILNFQTARFFARMNEAFACILLSIVVDSKEEIIEPF